MRVTDVRNTTFPKLEALADGLRTRVSWDDLRIFLAVAETGSFSAAGRLLNMTTSNVSRRVADLGATLRARLLVVRPGQKVALTEGGEFVRDHARTMKRSVSTIERTIASQDEKPEGRVAVSSTDGVAAYILSPALGDFFEANPLIQIDLDCGLWSTDPMPTPADLTITVEQDERGDFVSAPLATIHYLLAASHRYINTYGMPKSVAAIANHRFVEFVALSRQRDDWPSWTAPLRELTDFTLQHNSSAVHFQAITNGAGIGPMPTFLLRTQDQLRIVHDQPMFSARYFLRYHMDAKNSARVKIVADWIKRLFSGRDQPWFREEFIHPDQYPG